LVPAGATCPCRSKAKAEAARQYDADRGSASERGYDWQWHLLRERHLAESPLCVACLADEIVAVADDVDHVIPISIAPHRRLDRTNLQSLCRKHHNEKTRRETAAQAAGGPKL
jgi:5-methylcytosine-specific restriction protein A